MPETERKCPDEGRCHHQCGQRSCFRVKTCGPLSGVYIGDLWPADVRIAEEARDGPVPDPILPPGGGEPEMLTSERIYAELRQYQHLGVLEYIVPTDPLGEEWIVGVQGQIVKMIGDDQAAAFLAGCAALAHWAHAQIARDRPAWADRQVPFVPFETGDRPRSAAETDWDASRGDE